MTAGCVGRTWTAWGLIGALGACAAPARGNDWHDLGTTERADKLFDQLDNEQRFIRLPDAVVRFVEISPAGAPAVPVIFVHGLGGALGDFGPVFLDVGRTFRAIAIDLPGFGASISLSGNYSIDNVARTLMAFLRALDIPEAHLVCHSMGGQICLATTLEHPEQVASLTLIDAAGVYDREDFLQGVSRRLGRVNIGGVPMDRPDRAISSFATHGDPELFRRLLARDSFTLAALASFRANFRHRIREIEVPTLIIWGAEDPLFAIDDAFALHATIRGSRLYIVDHAGHTPQLSHHGQVVEWWRGFQERMERRDD